MDEFELFELLQKLHFSLSDAVSYRTKLLEVLDGTEFDELPEYIQDKMLTIQSTLDDLQELK